jgi:hypothetical protein
MSVPWLLVTTLRLSVPLYLSTVLLGLLPTTVAMLGLMPLAGDRPWRADLVSPGWMNVAAELFMSTAYTRQTPEVLLLVVATLLVLPLILFGQAVVYSFLAGGILESLRVGTGVRLSFWAACRRWFWPFVRLSLLGGVFVAVASVLGAVVTRLAGSVIGPNVAALVQYALQAVVLGWLELSRAVMVAESERSVRRGLLRAGRGIVRPLVPVVWLLLALPGAGLLVAALAPPPADDPYSVLTFVQALLFGQILAFVGAWTKVVRLAVATRLAVVTRPPVVATLSSPGVGGG